jgi:hypothetical protein
MNDIKTTKRKVNFFEIITPGDADISFEQVLLDIANKPLEERRHFQSRVDMDEFHILYSFEKCSPESNMYQGIYMKCVINSITASNESAAELKEAKLPDGYRPTYMSHFVYSPQTGILSIESSQSAPKHLSLSRYHHFMQTEVLKRELVRFQVQAIIDEDIARIIRSADGVRAFEVAISSGELAAADKKGDWMGLASRLAGKGNTGKVTIGLSGSRGRGDMTEIMPKEQLAKEFENGEFKDVNFGSIRAELIYDQHAITVNLLQNKIKSDIEIPTSHLSKYTDQIFANVREVYESNKPILAQALTTVATRQYEADR